MKGLISNVIYMALKDWNTKRDDVRSFFNSDWGKTLCEGVGLCAKDILAKLENGKINVGTLEEVIV